MRGIVLVAIVLSGCSTSVTHRPVGERSYVVEAIGDEGPEQREALIRQRATAACGKRGYEERERNVEPIGLGARVSVLITCGAPPRPRGLNVVAGLDGVEVSIEPSGVAAWNLTIRNARATAVSVVWDESSYVAGGISAGRLIRGETRKIDVAKQQPNSPIAPNTALKEWVVPEKLAPMLDGDATLNPEAERGTLHLVFASDAGKETWSGAIVDGPKTAGAATE